MNNEVKQNDFNNDFINNEIVNTTTNNNNSSILTKYIFNGKSQFVRNATIIGSNRMHESKLTIDKKYWFMYPECKFSNRYSLTTDKKNFSLDYSPISSTDNDYKYKLIESYFTSYFFTIIKQLNQSYTTYTLDNNSNIKYWSKNCFQTKYLHAHSMAGSLHKSYLSNVNVNINENWYSDEMIKVLTTTEGNAFATNNNGLTSEMNFINQKNEKNQSEHQLLPCPRQRSNNSSFARNSPMITPRRQHNCIGSMNMNESSKHCLPSVLYAKNCNTPNLSTSSSLKTTTTMIKSVKNINRSERLINYQQPECLVGDKCSLNNMFQSRRLNSVNKNNRSLGCDSAGNLKHLSLTKPATSLKKQTNKHYLSSKTCGTSCVRHCTPDIQKTNKLKTLKYRSQRRLVSSSSGSVDFKLPSKSSISFVKPHILTNSKVVSDKNSLITHTARLQTCLSIPIIEVDWTDLQILNYFCEPIVTELRITTFLHESVLIKNYEPFCLIQHFNLPVIMNNCPVDHFTIQDIIPGIDGKPISVATSFQDDHSPIVVELNKKIQSNIVDKVNDFDKNCSKEHSNVMSGTSSDSSVDELLSTSSSLTAHSNNKQLVVKPRLVNPLNYLADISKVEIDDELYTQPIVITKTFQPNSDMFNDLISQVKISLVKVERHIKELDRYHDDNVGEECLNNIYDDGQLLSTHLATSCDQLKKFFGQLRAYDFRIHSMQSMIKLSTPCTSVVSMCELNSVWRNLLISTRKWIWKLQSTFVSNKSLNRLIHEFEKHLKHTRNQLNYYSHNTNGTFSSFEESLNLSSPILSSTLSSSSSSSRTSSPALSSSTTIISSDLLSCIHLLNTIKLRLTDWLTYSTLLLMTNDKDLCDVFRNHSLNELCDLSTNSDNQHNELLKIDLTKLHNHFSYLLNSCEHLLIECNRLFTLHCTNNKNNLSSVISTNSIQHNTTENSGSLSLLPPIKYDDLIKSGSQLFSNDCHGLENSWLHHFTSNIKGNDSSDLSDCNKSIDSILSNSSFNDFGVSNVSDELNNVHQTTEFFHLINMIQADKSTRQNVNNLDVKSLIKLYNLKQITNVLQYFVQSIPYHSLCLLHYCQYDEKYTNSIYNLSESLNEYEQCENISKLPIQTITSIMHNNSLMNTFNETMNKSSNRIKNSITLLNESDSKSFNEVLINSSLNQINCIVNDNKNHNDHNNTVVNDNDDNSSLYQYKYSFNAVFNRKNYNLYELINHERLLRNNSSFIYNNNKSHLLSAYNLSSSSLLQSDILSLPSTNIPYENKSIISYLNKYLSSIPKQLLLYFLVLFIGFYFIYYLLNCLLLRMNIHNENYALNCKLEFLQLLLSTIFSLFQSINNDSLSTSIDLLNEKILTISWPNNPPPF